MSRKLRKLLSASKRVRKVPNPPIAHDDYDRDTRLLSTAYLAEHPEGAPDWYSEAEINSWLRRKNYCEQIANELAGIIATNYQLAFNKGFAMGGKT